ncbi:hypothetical protein KC19_12G143400 [Ceratodon purpureus]|uniref:Uncharacterized protein n=1 Tax=Ceratodon purpureus TaxID=3225 RepID=A0A8T0G7X4_CERPU|nr:hypothetical protein KC19_12G143400 [Ceratodon purpureus]KAG0555092.1 hypothetical protein KC19_12G143400 [Ceratodon purpureus]
MAGSYEKYLYRNLRAVCVRGLSELATSKAGIHLLDILIRKEYEGVFPRRAVLKRAGSMTELGTESSADVQNSLREGLDDFESDDPIGDELFDWTYGDANVEETFASGGSLSGSLLAGPLAEVGAHFSHSRNLTVKFEDLSTACVDKEKLIDYVINKQWEPDVNNRRLEWPKPPTFVGRGGRSLWVIHQILFASKLEITSGASGSVGARACTVIPGAPGADMSVSREGSSGLNLTLGTKTKFPGKFMFAFRAVRFRFDAAGELIGKEDDAGKHLPVHRGDEGGLYEDEGAQIRDLFHEAPPEDKEMEADWDVQRLPIEEDTDEI